jgi:hypothetical protein
VQFIGYVNTRERASELIWLLHSKGVPTFSKHGNQSWVSSYQLALFVYLDQHYDDACKLMLDKNHKVENPVDVEEFEKLMEKQDHSLILKWSIIILAIVVIVFSFVAYLIYKGAIQNG